MGGTLQTTTTTSMDLTGYSGINSVTVTGSGIKLAVSFDSGTTWKVWVPASSTWNTITAANISTSGMTIATLNAVTAIQWRQIFQRTQLDFIVYFPTTSDYLTKIVASLPYNQAPKALNLAISPQTIHTGDAVLTADLIDDEEQQSSYRILVDTTVIKDWTSFGTNASISENIPVDTLSFASHTVHVETRDSVGASADYTINITRVNTTPTCSVVWDSRHVSATIGDADGDRISYRFLVNDMEKIPWTSWLDPGSTFIYRFRRGELPVGTNNKVEIQYKDALGVTGSWTENIVGTYVNLMFMDTDGNYYSDADGSVLSLLNLGIIKAGDMSAVVEIIIKNYTGWPVRNIEVHSDEKYAPEVNVELSYNRDPFIPVTPWQVPTTLADGDGISLFMRLNTDSASYRGGDFKLYVSGEIVLS